MIAHIYQCHHIILDMRPGIVIHIQSISIHIQTMTRWNLNEKEKIDLIKCKGDRHKKNYY